MNQTPPSKLTWPIRVAASVCLLLSVAVGVWSTGEAMGLFQLSSESVQVPGGLDPQLVAELRRAQAAALKPMQVPRAITLLTLATVCGVTMMGAFRLLKPGRLPLEAARRLTSQAALFAAVVRTIDGAQQAVVAKRAAPQVANLLVQMTRPADAAAAQALRQVAPDFSVASVALLTFFVAGTFCGLWQYLRSKSVQEALARVVR